MTGQNANFRLHKNLLARRAHLRKKLAGELAYLHGGNAANATADSADLAFEAGGADVSSRLAELDDRELIQIERALARWRRGVYGICEGGSWNCRKTIAVARLNALPYTPFCINCEREMEQSPDGEARQSTGSWSQISDGPAAMQDQRINLSELARDLSGSRRG